MLHRTKRVCCALLIFGLAATADAAMVDHGSYVSDTTTGLDWYKNSNTAGMTYNEVKAQLSSSLSGWNFASASQLNQLLGEFGLYQGASSSEATCNGCSFVPSSPAEIQKIRDFTSVMGNTFVSEPMIYGVVGFYGDTFQNGLRANDYHVYTSGSFSNQTDYAMTTSSTYSFWSAYLTRQTSPVPEPTSLALLTFGLAGMGAVGRLKRRR